jgi:hypothetical protein
MTAGMLDTSMTLYGLYGWSDQFRNNADLVRATGFRWLRGNNNAETDQDVLTAAQNGINVALCVLDKDLARKNDMAGWRSKVNGWVKRYGPNGSLWKENPKAPYLPVRYYEIWNEPNIEFLDPPEGMLRDELYFNLLKTAYEEIKKIDPSLKVVAMNTAGGASDHGSLEPRGMFIKIKYMGFLRFIEGVHNLGGEKYYDILALHPYTQPRPPDVGGVAEGVRMVREEMAKRGVGDKPIWFTEVGFSLDYPGCPLCVTEDQQADYTLRLFGLAARLGVEQVQLMYVEDIVYGPDNSSRQFGFYNNHQPRPVAQAVKLMIELMPHPELIETISDGNNTHNSLYAYRFKGRGNSRVIMAWTPGEPFSTSLPVNAEKATLWKRDGRSKELKTKDGALRLTVSGSPVFIVTTP